MKKENFKFYSEKVLESKKHFATGNMHKWVKQNKKKNRMSGTLKGISVNFMGCNSLYITDGTTKLLIDPYFSRHEYGLCDLKDQEKKSDRYADKRKKEELLKNKPPNELASDYLKKHISDPPEINRFSPIPQRIEHALDLAGINKVDAIITTHAHFDHAFDLAEVSKVLHSRNSNGYTPIYGCKSVANVVLGSFMSVKDHANYRKELFSDLCEKYNINIVQSKVTFGDLSISFIKGRHIQIPFASRPDFIGGKVDKPIELPASFSEYNEGTLHNLLIEHKKYGRMLILGSANFIEDDFKKRFKSDDIGIDAMIIGVAGLSFWGGALVGPEGLGDGKDIHDYYDEVIVPCDPKSIYFSHWDEFKFPLDHKLEWFTKPWRVFNTFQDKGPKFTIEYLPVWENIKVLPV